MKFKAIYGGAFDPIHWGHLDVAQAVTGLLGIPVELCPSFQHPFDKKMARFEFRLAMAMIATREMPNIGISLTERDNPGGFTFNLLERLQEENPGVTLMPILGEADARQIGTWTLSPELLKKYAFIIVPRYPAITTNNDDGWYKRGSNIYLREAKPRPYSSTEVRRRVENRESIEDLVPPKVAQMIRGFGLYKPTNSDLIPA